ncbi:MAG TPA: hypothetical protein VH478_13510 [Trebonia sp.]|jgi:hypothetical protein|nr:hypothetical protein [Trebonia sp.]
MTAPGVVPAGELVTFLQHRLPGLEDGRYQLTVSQRVDDAGGEPVSGEAFSRTWTFAVAGDRFRLGNPAATVASVFPASNASGEFSTALPHVVFTAPAFPWSRSPAAGPPARPAAGLDSEGDAATWLAVLVLDDDDVAACPGLALEPVTAVTGDLFPPAAYPASTLGAGYSYFAGATGTSGLGPGEAAGDPVQVLDVPLRLFADIAPTLADLSLSAHVRQVSVENKPMALGDQPPGDPTGTFAIVIGTRLPQPGKLSHAYLVSLEALAGYLPATSEGGTPAAPGLDLARSLRLAVLQHWTFAATGEPSAFTDQLQQLNGRAAGGPDAACPNLRLTVPGASGPVATALAAGYVPLDHGLRTGEATVSWYRGPLSPADQARPGPPLPVSSPDQVLAFDPTTGMLDASLAAAWTIGRLMALQDQSYAASLYAWKKGQAQAVVDAAERQVIDAALAGLIQAPPGATATTTTLLHDTMRLIKDAGTS